MKTLIVAGILIMSGNCFAGSIDTDSGVKASQDGTIPSSQYTPDMSSGHSVDTDSGARAANQGVM